MTASDPPLDAMERDLARKVVVFNYRPIDYLHPDRLAGLLPSVLPEGARRALLTCGRTRCRLSRRVVECFCPKPCRFEHFRQTDRRMVLEGPDCVKRVTRVAGAVWHSGFLRTIVMGPTLRQVLEAIGAEAHAFALSHLELGGRMETEVPLEELRSTLERDGIGCLKAWAAQQPEGLPERLALMHAPAAWDDSASALAQPDVAARIVAAVAGELLADG